VPEPELAERLERFKAAARRAGIRLTHQRLEIFREVAATEEHPDAETVFRGIRKRVPTVSLDTVYRTLWLLEDLGLIATLGPRRERALRCEPRLASPLRLRELRARARLREPGVRHARRTG